MKYLLILLLSSPYLLADEKLALTTIKQFGKSLKTELQKGMKKSPMEALKVCNEKAPALAINASSEKVQLGRVSLKNRNPDNYPKPWMMKYVNGFHNKEIATSYVVIERPNNKKVLLKPIKTMPLCLNCHGTNISSELKKSITKLYPNDKAVGYKVGEIRGFFWAEY